jgi:hypothetical protein
MSSREIHIDGVTYLRSRAAARIVQLAPDYVSRYASTRRACCNMASFVADGLN